MTKPIKKKIISAKNLVEDQLMGDGYNNFTAKLGLQTENLSSIATYTLGNLISRNHVQLESIYRTSWIAGQVIDTVAEDMTKEGITMMSKLSPDDIQKMSASLTELGIWQKLCSTIKWARLYGGAIAVMLIDGADYTKPFDAAKVRKDSFKGLAVFDRWQLEPSYNDLVTELGPDMGKPKFYTILPAMETMSTIKVHYSRVVRLEGIEMPYYQKKYDNLWGMSVIERMLDRLMAFDSATQGAAQLIYKAHLRVVQIDGLRQALAMGGKTESAVIKQFQYIRLMQTNEGITLLDKNDTFTPHQYTFSGLADMLIQFGQQISGAVNIPLVRLFGQSPSGFNSGEADLRNYYDNVGKLQESMLRMPIFKILDTLCMSVNGKPLPEDFEFDFNSLWQPSEVEKSQIVNNDVSALNIAFQAGMITKKIAMKELAQRSHVTGRFSNITDEDIEKAEEEPPEHQSMGGAGEEENQEVDLKGLQEKIGQKEPEPEADDVVEKKSLEQLEAELNELGGSEGKSLEDLEAELRKLDPVTLEQLEAELNKLGPEPTFEQLEETLRNIKANADPELMQLEKQLNEIDTSMPITPAKKMTIDNKGLLSRAWDSFKRIFTDDRQLQAPKGGVTVKGKKFSGGEFIPSAGGYAAEYKKQKEGEAPASEKPAPLTSEKRQQLINRKAEIKEKLKELAARKTEIDKKLPESKEKSKELAARKAELGNKLSELNGPSKSGVVKFEGMGTLDRAKVNLINQVKMSENHVKDLLTFDGYETTAHYEFPKSQKGVCYVIAKATNKDGEFVDTTISVDIDHPDDVHLNYLEISGKGKGTAKSYLKKLEDHARATGKKTISLDADISIGRYAWAKLGFEASDPDYLRDMKRHFIPYAKKVLAMNGQKDYSKEIAQMERDIAGFKRVEDVCDYRFPDTDFTHEQLKKIGYMNDDVPTDLKMHLGKSYMTHQKLKQFTGYTGVKTVGKTGDSMGAFLGGELETKDAESKPILIVSDPDHGVKEGQSDFEFHKDLMLGE